jgi:hypothetical protein
MSVDPTDPDTFEDEADQDAADLGVEVPEADAAEQAADLAALREALAPDRVRDSANEADVAEQSRTVTGLGEEEDYR